MDIKFIKSLKILNLQEDANLEDIKTAYRQLVKIHHPDLYNNEDNIKKATKNFKIITEAYEYLKQNYISPEKRTFEKENQNKQQYTHKKGTRKNSFETYSKDKNDELIYLLKKCIETRTKIKIKYRSSSYYGSKYSERIVQPLDLFLGQELKTLMNSKYNYEKDSIYLIAFCELRNDKRTFRLDRIISAKIYENDVEETENTSNKENENNYTNQNNTNNDSNIGCFIWIIIIIIFIIFSNL